MLKVILIAVFPFALAEMYHENANYEYTHGTASTHLFPNYTVANKKVSQKFKVMKELESGIAFEVTLDEKNFSLRTVYGQMKLSRFMFNFSETGDRLTIRFTWPNTTPKKIVIISEVLTPASTQGLQNHAKEHAVSIQPMTLEDIDTLLDQRDTKTKYITLSAEWIADLIGKKSPLFKPISQSNDLWVFSCLPTIMDADILQKLSQLGQKMEIAN